MTECTIEWNGLSLPAWEERFARLHRANLLQSYDYACAVCPLYHQKARWGLIRIDGKEAGLVQILEAGIFGNLIHALVLDRGPLWFDGFGKTEQIRAFFETLNRQFPRRLGRRRRILPEAEDAALITQAGFKKLPRPGYRTIWLDLRPDEQALLAGLKKNWRGALQKAERAGIEIEWDREGKYLSWLLINYQSDRAKKGYDGPSVKILKQLAKVFVPKDRLLIGRAILDNRPVAAILILCHGSGATYQLGWSAEAGRRVAAHNLLLWQAVCRLKQNRIFDFDLGGVNEDVKGIKKFKEGMGGQTVTYAGHFF